jgi:hypothetical protein
MENSVTDTSQIIVDIVDDQELVIPRGDLTNTKTNLLKNAVEKRLVNAVL